MLLVFGDAAVKIIRHTRVKRSAFAGNDIHQKRFLIAKSEHSRANSYKVNLSAGDLKRHH
jgi:hypothetical protein